ncbi:MAG: DUF418 domain-containing protein [Nitriliruptoraceae bacterium]
MSSEMSSQPPVTAGPTPQSQRVDTLDVLRGLALMGILLVNIELFRGPVLFDLLAERSADTSRADDVAKFLVGWLASGKFISSFSLMFGVGAAMMFQRARAAGRRPRALLARRYAWLLVFGLAHMFLLFPGDILFIYGLGGLLLLLFVKRTNRTVVWWAGILLTLNTLFLLAGSVLTTLAPATPEGDAAAAGVTQMFADLSDRALEAYTSGDLGARAGVRAWEVLIVQGGSMFVLPMVLALFLIGLAIGRSGLITNLAGHRHRLRRASLIGLGGGLVLNVPVGLTGTLGGAAVGPDTDLSVGLLAAGAVGQGIGAPLLAIGYLATLALACQNPAVLRRLGALRDTGRMALSGYILQSVLTSTFFVWLGYYGQLSMVASLGVVVGVWIVMLVSCSVWQRRWGRGPLERLWRHLTYGRATSPA